MNIKKISLGENAFDAERETFLLIDTSGEEKQLAKQGQANGRINSPGPQATHADAVEQGIIKQVMQTATQTRSELSNHFVSFFERLLAISQAHEPEALMQKIQAYPAAMETRLKGMHKEFQNKSAIAMPEWRREEKTYNDFRTDNQLTRAPDYLSPRSRIFWFIFIILAEAALNATLLWELTGILLAIGQTLLITMVNVLFGATLTGLFFRYKNVASWRRWLSLLCIPVVLGVLAFNFGVGHYRDAITDFRAEQEQQLSTDLNWDDTATQIDLGIVDYAQEAMASMKATPFEIDSVLSVLLIIVGIGFFGFATHKWYFMLDPYPGYRKCYLALEKKHEIYRNLVESTRKEFERVIKNTNDRVADERTKVLNIRQQRNDLGTRATTLQDSYTKWVLLLDQTQNYLLEVYRDNNQQTRSAPAPEHFNHAIPIDASLSEAPNFIPPNAENLDLIVAATKQARDKTKEIADGIWRRFNPDANMQMDA